MTTSIEDFISQVDLKNVMFVGVNGTINPEYDREQLTKELDLDYQIVSWDQEIRIAFRLALKEQSSAQLAVEVLVLYTNSENLDLANDDKSLFVSDVAFMTAFPYLREGFTTLAIRMQLPPPVIGIMRRGEFVVDVENDQPSIESGAQ